jgi:hypothetical protein
VQFVRRQKKIELGILNPRRSFRTVKGWESPQSRTEITKTTSDSGLTKSTFNAGKNRVARWTIGCRRNANGIRHWSFRRSIRYLTNVTMPPLSAFGLQITFSTVHIEPGREGLFNLIKSLPPTLKYEPGTIVAEGDFVILHGRFSGFGQPVNWIAADIVRIKDGVLAEHWDVIQDEATKQESKSELPMFGDSFGK